MGRRIWLALLFSAVAAPVFAQFDGRQTLSNQPASIPTENAWPVPPQTSPLTNRVSTQPAAEAVTTTPAINPFAAAPVEAVPEPKTPIRRDGATTSEKASSEGKEKPAAAEMLRTGAWNSGLAVLGLVVLGVVVVTFLKRRHPQLSGGLPREVCDVLGRKRIDPRTSVCLVRLGNRILVLGSTADSVTPLAEIDDPVEVDQIAGLCRLSDGSSMPSFGNLLKQRTKPEPKRQAASKGRRDRSQEPADLPARRDLRPGQKLDLTTP